MIATHVVVVTTDTSSTAVAPYAARMSSSYGAVTLKKSFSLKRVPLAASKSCSESKSASPALSAGDERAEPIGWKTPSSDVPTASIMSKTTSGSGARVSGSTACAKTWWESNAQGSVVRSWVRASIEGARMMGEG